MPDTNDPKPDTSKPDAPKPDEARDSGFAQAYDRIKSAEQDLARLDRLVSGMERESESPRASRASAAPAAAATPGDEAPKPDARVPSPYVPNTGGRDRGLKKDPAMMRALVILVLAIALLGAAVASQYRDEAQSIGQSIMARWAPPAASTPPQAPAAENPVQPPVVLLAAADEPSPVAAPPVPKETDSAPKSGAAAPEASSSELAQSLKAITSELASINGKLEQLKSRNEQTLREQADTIQQLKTAQEKDAADNARLAAQVQALQTQLTASPASSASAAAKPVVRSVNNDAAARARAHVPDAAPRRPRPPPRGPWMPPPYDPYYGDPDW
ncbi:flagellar motility protein MotE (MotC chaperone) [Bradyrhizobium sp. CIR48]|nr:flagellar motility protein MotE (MotC chaperone) [Bradyrhizobium sp. CIR48]